MQHGSHAGHREVGFQMLLVVPLKGGHTIPGSNTDSLQGRGELLASIREVRETDAPAVVTLECDDLTVCEDATPMVEN